MSEYVLSCCSPCDLSNEHLERIRVKYLPFHFFVDEKDHLDDMGRSFTPQMLYERMESGSQVRSSQCSVGEYLEYFRAFSDKGLDIIHLTLSSGISGTHNSAISAKNLLSEEYPERKIIIVDSLCACSGYGMLIDYLAEKKAAGTGIDDLEKLALIMRRKVNHLFFSTDLKYYIKGGRISKTSGLIGTALSICPLLCVSPNGKLVPLAKKRGKKQVIEKMLAEMEARAKDGLLYSERCYIAHSLDIEDATVLKDALEERFTALKGKVKIYPIGSTIGCHTGPGTVALFFFGADDRKI